MRKGKGKGKNGILCHLETINRLWNTVVIGLCFRNEEGGQRNSAKRGNLFFNKADLTQVQFFNTKLKGVDLSNSTIEEMAISIEDVQGAIINKLQVLDLSYLLGVKIKDW